MLNRITVATILSLLVGLFAVSAASAASPSDRDPIPPPTDYWQDKGFILMAHQGGEWDFPPNTLFSYKSAMANGADMIDMDAYVTKDGKVVLTHDLDARKNSDLTDAMFGGKHDINDLTLPQLKTLDFAYKWSPRDGSSVTPYRGVATWNEPAPRGFTANDFKIPTFGEVLAAFPDTPINIELKAVPGVSEDDTTAEMARVLENHPGHDENVIINSFGESMLQKMHTARPEHKSFGGSLSGTAGYINGDPIVPTPVAVEPPDYYQLGSGGPWLRLVPILKPWADHDGYQIYAWGSDHDPAQDTPDFYKTLIDEGADSYNTPDPIALAAYLCENGISRPDGSPRCAQQVCPEGQVGIAPDNCKYPPCPEGTEGTPPDCQPIPCPEGTEGTPPDCVAPALATVRKVGFMSKRSKVRAGNKRMVTIKVSAANDGKLHKVKVRLKSSNPRVWVQKSVKVTVRPGKTVRKNVNVKAYRKARGKTRLTAWKGHDHGGMTLKVKPKG